MRPFTIGRFMVGLGLLLFGGAVHAQDYSSSQYCDPVCLQRPLGYDCSYHNYAQCWATVSGLGGLCVDNPFLGMCTRGTGTAHSPVRRSKHKQVQ